MVPSKLTLAKMQDYYKKKAKERGFSDESPKDILVLLMEELGELARAVRKHVGIKIDTKTEIPEVEEELADVLIYTIHMANRLRVDLEKAFREKEKENEKRKWKTLTDD